MDYILNLILLLGGFFFLVKGADLFVDGSSSVAKIFKIPSVIIGLTIVSIGTSLPEAAVSITSSLQGSYDLSIANVIGSNIFNLLVVVGASAIICPFVVDKMIIKRDFPICIGITALLTLMLTDNTLSRVEAGILLVTFVIYIIALIISALKQPSAPETEENPLPVGKSLLFILLGGVGIILGGTFTVDSAKFFAEVFGMSEMLIGLTVVAVGTSLPELVTSIVAAKKGESDIALGNAVGSCIFNVMFILGMSGLVHPLTCGPEALIDTAILIAVSLVMAVVCLTGKKANRPEGAVCVILYVVYVAYTIMRAFNMLPF